MNTNCITDLAPVLSQAEQHSAHGGLLANEAIATFFDVNETAIRSLKKRLTDEAAISEGRHWLKGENNKTLWTIRGFIRLGMRLSSAPALAFQQHLEELLSALDAGQIQIVPVDGQAVGVELRPVATDAITPLPLVTDEPVSDEQVQAIARPIAAAVFEQRQQHRGSLEARVNDAIASELQQLEQQAEPLGKSLALRWGLPLEQVTPLLQGAT